MPSDKVVVSLSDKLNGLGIHNDRDSSIQGRPRPRQRHVSEPREEESPQIRRRAGSMPSRSSFKRIRAEKNRKKQQEKTDHLKVPQQEHFKSSSEEDMSKCKTNQFNPSPKLPTRSLSCKKQFRPTELNVWEMRPRTRSMPSRSSRSRVSKERNPSALDDDEYHLYRVRSFTTSTRKIVNQGDKIMARSTSSIGSNGSTGNRFDDEAFRVRSYSATSQTSTLSAASSAGLSAAIYQVLVLGSNGVGKTAITQQFMTSEYMGSVDTCDDESSEMTVSVMLDGAEATMIFTDIPPEREHHSYKNIDAYVVVYSITDIESVQYADDVIQEILKTNANHPAIILVANKTDLVRSRLISTEEGKSLAMSYDCKFSEVSATLNHKIDDLLVGILSQIRLNRKRHDGKRKKTQHQRQEEHNGCVHKAARDIFKRIFKRSPFRSRSCDNLLVL